MHEVYLGLGSNLGDREQQLRQAVRLVDERVGRVVRQSSFIQTEPWGFQSEHLFLNAAICCLTDKTPREVLQLTQQIEREDIDILLYDDWKVDEPDLKIPHPLMHQRDFVMIPLKEILTEQTNP